MTRRRRMGPERPFAAVMAAAAIWVVGGYLWLNPVRLEPLSIGVTVAVIAFGLLCAWGAVELWQMGRDRR